MRLHPVTRGNAGSRRVPQCPLLSTSGLATRRVYLQAGLVTRVAASRVHMGASQVRMVAGRVRAVAVSVTYGCRLGRRAGLPHCCEGYRHEHGEDEATRGNDSRGVNTLEHLVQ